MASTYHYHHHPYLARRWASITINISSKQRINEQGDLPAGNKGSEGTISAVGKKNQVSNHRISRYHIPHVLLVVGHSGESNDYDDDEQARKQERQYSSYLGFLHSIKVWHVLGQWHRILHISSGILEENRFPYSPPQRVCRASGDAVLLALGPLTVLVVSCLASLSSSSPLFLALPFSSLSSSSHSLHLRRPRPRPIPYFTRHCPAASCLQSNSTMFPCSKVQ